MPLLSFWKRSIQDTATARIFRRIEETPDRLCARVLGDGETTSISYRRLAERAAPYVAACKEHKVRPGDRVIVLFDHGPELLYAFFGAMFAGAVPTMMPPPSPRQDPKHFWCGQKEVIDRIDAQLVFTTAKLKTTLDSLIPDYRFAVATPDGLPDTSRLQIYEAGSEDVAFLQHSSGTTGTKKGVMITHAALLHQLDSYARALHLSDSDRIVSWLPLYHDMGLVACFLLPVLKGVPVTMMSPFDWVLRPTTLFDVIEQVKATLVWQPNFAFQHLRNCVRPDDSWDLSSVRAFIDCSERCRPETLDTFAGTFAEMGLAKPYLQTCYAMAENVFAATQNDLNRTPRVETIDTKALVDEGVARPSLDPKERSTALLSCGKPIDAVSVVIMDEAGNRLPDRRIGEICISGPSLARGYDHQPEKTEAVFRGGWYHSRDLGYLSNGELFVTGRMDDLLILNGRNHYAHDLEFALRDIPGIVPGRVATFAEYREDVGSDTLIVLAETRETDPGAIKTIKKTIRDVMVDETGLMPSTVQLLPPQWLIKSTSGKISREATWQKYEACDGEDFL